LNIIENIEILEETESMQNQSNPETLTRDNQILNQMQNLNTFHAVPNDENISSREIALPQIRNTQQLEMFHMPPSALIQLKVDRESRCQKYLTFLRAQAPTIAKILLVGLFYVLVFIILDFYLYSTFSEYTRPLLFDDFK
jgi:hypothetical protein